MCLVKTSFRKFGKFSEFLRSQKYINIRLQKIKFDLDFQSHFKNKYMSFVN